MDWPVYVAPAKVRVAVAKAVKSVQRITLAAAMNAVRAASATEAHPESAATEHRILKVTKVSTTILQ